MAPARKPPPKKAAPGKATGGGTRTAPSKAPARKVPATRTPAAKVAAGKVAAGKAPASKSTLGKPASSKADISRPGRSPTKATPTKATPTRATPSKESKTGPASKAPAGARPTTGSKGSAVPSAGPSVAKTSPAAPSGARAGGGATAKAPAPAARPLGGGRPLHARPRLPKGDLGGEKIVLVPARTSEPARARSSAATRAGGERVVLSAAARAAAAAVTTALPLPVRKRDAPMTLEERAASIEKRLNAQSEEFRQRYWDSFYMSWIYHDSALEGVVYTFEELRTALGSGGVAPPPPPPPPGEEGATESNIQPACEEIRRHREAIDYIRDYAKKKGPITIDVVRKIFLILHPEEGDLKTVKYRRDIPQHRLYFHEYAQPDKIAYKVRQVIDWLNDPETRKGRNGLRIAARAHYDLLRVFPFQSDSGKVSRLFMNLLLLRAGLPPSIIHSAERQRYYDALKGSANQILAMVQESVDNAVLSVEKLLDEHEAKSRPALT